MYGDENGGEIEGGERHKTLLLQPEIRTKPDPSYPYVGREEEERWGQNFRSQRLMPQMINQDFQEGH